MKIEDKLFTSVENSVTFTMSSYIKSKELDVFPNLNTVMRMFLSTAVANCTEERSFSVLKRVKNNLRSTMSVEKLNALALLNIENKLLNAIGLNDVINDFNSKKAKKKL
ncbi:zinc finger MYM-type protein 1-like [Aphis craccivora]|uniref:Zinc finger MYM-type protein 1-like n=1 Tax=Aphis craccivora TaxID=307492 RepID=A0A6G0Z0N7_APHCR|nr:zinc finger MYM-type protein 1-like [Aphis craccivora]